MFAISVTVFVVTFIILICACEYYNPGNILPWRYKERGEVPPAMLDGEKIIADEYFGMIDMDVDCLQKHLKSIGVNSDTMNDLQEFVNRYSKAGFLRYLEFGHELDKCRKEAAILVCYLLNIPYWNLWKHRYMDKRSARGFIVTLRG